MYKTLIKIIKRNVNSGMISKISKIRDCLWLSVDNFLNYIFKNSRPYVITFTGGMGAQVISAAIYFFLKEKGHTVYADLSYFEKKPHVAIEGQKGNISHWGWQLEQFNLYQHTFSPIPNINRLQYSLIKDGDYKLNLGVEALSTKQVKSYFQCRHYNHKKNQFNLGAENYLCIHIRRGDYVNVASHLIADELFTNLSIKFTKLINTAVVISDSPISKNVRNDIGKYFKNAEFLDGIDVIQAHIIMRNAKVLICSNSQFSLVSALLNEHGMVFIPKKWFDKSNKNMTKEMNKQSFFQVLQ
jgi:hypothetical protein